MPRYTVHYSGHVQGVGFRFNARQVAQAYRVSGFVENIDDGRVRLVAEGETAELDRFLEELSARMARFIKERTVAICESSGEFGTPGIDPLTIRR